MKYNKRKSNHISQWEYFKNKNERKKEGRKERKNLRNCSLGVATWKSLLILLFWTVNWKKNWFINKIFSEIWMYLKDKM